MATFKSFMLLCFYFFLFEKFFPTLMLSSVFWKVFGFAFPSGSAGKESALQCRRPGFEPWVGNIPWRRERLPTPVFWPGEFHELCSPWGCKESDMTERLSLSLEMEMATQSRTLPRKSHGQRSLVGYSLWDRKESDTPERLALHLLTPNSTYYFWREVERRMSFFLPIGLGSFLSCSFIHFWLCWVFTAARAAFSSGGELGLLSRCGVRASRGSGFSCCGAWVLGPSGFSNCCTWAQEWQLQGSGAQAQ